MDDILLKILYQGTYVTKDGESVAIPRAHCTRCADCPVCGAKNQKAIRILIDILANKMRNIREMEDQIRSLEENLEMTEGGEK